MISRLIAVVMLAAVLTGCAGIASEVDVQARRPAKLGEGAGTYVLADSPFKVPAHELALVNAALARHGLTLVQSGQAHYRVSLAYATRLQSITVVDSSCATRGYCSDVRAPFSWPWQKTYVHSLTLRFFDRSNGQEIYKVHASRHDHRADADEAFPYLIESALARWPYPRDGRWQLRLGPAEAGAVPRVLSAKPRAR